MGRCSKANYEEYKKIKDVYKDSGSEIFKNCGYQNVVCKYRYGNTEFTDENCKVTRKGSSSWRDAGKKPSFKVTLDNTNVLGTFECKGESCPLGKDINEWSVKKFKLHNQVQDTGEIDSYKLYRDTIEYKATPLSIPAQVDLHVDGALISSEQYALTEEINDSKFMEKFFGEETSYMLFEVDKASVEFKRGAKLFKDDDVVAVVNVSLMERITNFLQITDVNQTQMLKYFVGEKLTAHWDGACFNEHSSNNHYIAYLHETDEFHFIPSGMDQTFQGCKADLLLADSAKCPPVMGCFERNASCIAEYEALLLDASERAHRKKASCGSQVATSVLVGFVSSISATIVLLVLLLGARVVRVRLL
jgi:hypothetical protein